MKYSKVIKAVEDNSILAFIYRDRDATLELVDKKRFGYSDASFMSYMFGDETAQREDKFKLAHKWADEYIEQLEEHECGVA